MRRALLSVLLSFACVAADIGRILQVSDFHYDHDYNPRGNIKELCHVDSTQPASTTNLGEYGNYMCDAPEVLVSHAILGAQRVLPNPDLILWTGDNVPHIDKYDEEYVARAINVTTTLMRKAFPETLILPVFGNHDYAPSNDFPDNGSDTYSGVFELWKGWIGENSRETFLRGGYYKYVNSDGVVFLMLNTNLYYRFNNANLTDKSDPAGQFQFMENVLSGAKAANQIVHVISHIAPGVFERTPNFTWMVPEYNKRFLEVTVKYASTIKWMLFGHHHTDTFHIVKNGAQEAVQLMLMCPAVTPWFSDLSGAGANNPAFRVIEYDRSTWTYSDIRTYYINLDRLNQDPETKWTSEYSMKNAYNLSSIDSKAMMELLNNFKHDDALFYKYIEYNSVLWKPKMPTGQFRAAQLCSLEFPDLAQYNECMQSASSSDSFRGDRTAQALLIASVLAALHFAGF